MAGNTQAFISIAQQIAAAMTAGNTTLASQLAGAFHFGAMNGHIDYKNKTMTVSWEQANPQTAPLLMAEGFTIIPD